MGWDGPLAPVPREGAVSREHAVPDLAHDITEQLQQALDGSVVVERELGGGGMSRVFLAHDRALDRRIVVKVLPSEMLGRGAERFRREIQLSAQLQHPHIVPVLQAGLSRALLFYTMPYVEGETLRARMGRGERMPVDEALWILRDLADALAYAHERGVVHRDIKPENILLSGGHALVTDFGVAKALSDVERAEDDAGDTGAGIAIGTPAYMAPEQAAGDPDTDHRADLYALGVLAYELLAGRLPFAARGAREMLAAHLAEQPAPLADRRADVPADLAALVMQCLEKHPADRPASAAELRRALYAIPTPGAGSPRAQRGRRRAARWRVAAAIAASVFLAAAGGTLIALRSRAAPVDENVVAVLPFHVAEGAPELRWLREGMLDLLSARLTGVGGPRSADPRRVLQALRATGGSDTADLSRERTLELAEQLGAGRVLSGDIGGTPDHLVLDASLLRVRDGRAVAQVRVEGPSDSLPSLVNRMAAKLMAIGAGESERLWALTATPLPALQAYLEGQALYRRARYRDAALSFERALGYDSTFALAALGLATASGWYGAPKAMWHGMTLAWAQRARLSPRDRALLEAIAGPRFPAPSSEAERIDAARRYLTVAPDRAEAWFQLGDALLHFGAAVGTADAASLAAQAMRRALALDSAFAPAIEHLAMLDARLGDTASVRRLAVLYVAVDSTGENADGVRWRAAAALGDTAELARLRARAPAMSPASLHTIQLVSQLDAVDLASAERAAAVRLARPLVGAEAYTALAAAHDQALNRGRPREALSLTARYAAAEPYPHAALRERIRDALFWDGDTTAGAAAAGELARVVAAARPVTGDGDARAEQLVNVCTLEMWRLAHDDDRTAHRGIELLRGDARGGDRLTGAADFGAQCAVLLDAMRASLRREPGARAVAVRLDSLLRSGPGGMIQEMGNLVMARLAERDGDLAGALAALRRRDYYLSRPAFLSTYLREEGRIADQLGDRAAAIAAYRRYLALRERPEPALAPHVAAVRSRLMVLLRAEPG